MGRQEIAAGTDAIDVALKTAVQPNPTLGVLMQTVTRAPFSERWSRTSVDGGTPNSTRSRSSLGRAWPVSSRALGLRSTQR
jgi:hypothetical protein